MNLKKLATGSVLTLAVLAGASSAFAFSADYSYTGSVPAWGGNLWTPTHAASGATQGVKVKSAEENATLYATVTDAAHNALGVQEVPCKIGSWASVQSGASQGKSIAVLLETSALQNDNISVSYDVDF